jgi:hypothetical protein
MSLPLYLLRRATPNISSALYVPEKRDLSVHIINSQSDDHSSSQQAAFMKIGDGDSLTQRDLLTYAQLLELVVNAEKVVIL